MEDWKKMLKFAYDLGKDKKFSNNFEYGRYNIIEIIDGKNATVRFEAKENQSGSTIIYGLEKRQSKWIVISIDYLK